MPEADAGPTDDFEVGDEEAPSEPSKSPAPPAAGSPPAAPPEQARDDAAEAADEELGESESDEELEGVDTRKPPAKGKGSIVGVVTDTKFNEPLIEAQVEVIGKKEKALTDVEGRFRLDLPPGVYSLRVSYELHKSMRLDAVHVVVNRLHELNLELVPDEGAVEEIAVETEFEKTTAEGQMLARKRAAVISDRVGRAEIARTPDRNAAEAARRLVGVTIVEGRFVYVRGLGDRYTNALLNGTPLPSPEPDRQAVPLDLFPSLVLEGLNVVKVFQPDMPGDFAGGSVVIETRQFPKETLFQVSLNAGYNTRATLHDRIDYPGSSTDWLGFDSGQRSLPQGIPDHKLDQTAPADERVKWGRELNSYLSTKRKLTPPNFGGSVVAGDSWKVGKDQKVGALFAVGYGRSFQIQKRTVKNYLPVELPDGTFGPRAVDDFSGERGIDTVKWGAFGSAAYELDREHSFRLTMLHSQAADDITEEIEGTSEADPGVSRRTHLEFASRALNFAELRGEHLVTPLNRAKVNWYGAFAVAAREQPDVRDVVYERTDATSSRPAGYQFQTGALSGSHVFTEQSETTWNGGLDYTQPLTSRGEDGPKAKAGGLVMVRSRDFDARRFVIEPPPRGAVPITDLAYCPGAWNRSCPDQLFRNDVIDGARLTLRESTLPFDRYEAGLDVYAAYAMLDSDIVERLRLVGGARVEVTDEYFEATDPFNPETSLASAIESTDILPAVALTFAATPKTNTRLGVTQTLARPQLREMSPYYSQSYAAELPVQGNPDLELTKIVNADLRFEYFPTLREIAAFSFFYKHFRDPIEAIVLPTSGAGLVTFTNADAADLIGMEVEARKALGFLTPALEDFMLIGNLTLAKSRVTFSGNAGNPTNPTRPLSLQSPYVVNLSLDYSNKKTRTDVRLLYNVMGPRIVMAGQQNIPDTYEEPRHLVDATVAQKFGEHLELKLSGENLLDWPVTFSHRGATEYQRVDNGMNGYDYVALGEDPVTREYHTGAIFTLTGTYTY